MMPETKSGRLNDKTLKRVDFEFWGFHRIFIVFFIKIYKYYFYHVI